MKETRRVETARYDDNQNDWVLGRETEYAALNSVEIGQTAKGEWQIKSIKVYGSESEDIMVRLGGLVKGTEDLFAWLQNFGMVGE